MKRMAFFCAGTLAMAVAARAEGPVIARESVVFSQKGSPEATIRYRLTGGAAIVTVDIQTNVNGVATGADADWVSIGERNFRNVCGDVNALVSPSADEDKVVVWRVGDVLPEFKALNDSCRAVVRAWAPDAPPDYLVVDLRRDAARAAGEPRVRYYVSTNAFPEADNVQDDAYRTDFLAMRLIRSRGQTFRMGSPSGEAGRESNEVLHLVTFSEPDFYVAVYPTTIGQVLNFAHWFKGDNAGILDLQLDGQTGYGTGCLFQFQSLADSAASGYPTNHVAACCRHLNARGEADWPKDGHAVDDASLCGVMRARTGVAFDLPTEAQWEFFARAGTRGARYSDDLKGAVWFDGNADDGFSKVCRPVGRLAPNAWGLYDTLGTLWECCLDWYREDLGTDEARDPAGPASGDSGRVLRGGCYNYSAPYARSARRMGKANAWAVEYTFAGVRLVAPVGLTWPTAADNRMLTAEYSLAADTIVTADVQTNRTGTATARAEDWVSVGDGLLTDLFGDVNRRVSAGSGKKVFWRADAQFPGRVFAEGAIRLVVRKWDDANPPDYLVIDLRSDEERGATGSRERYYASAEALPHGGVTNRLYKREFMAMRRIPAQGVRWCMGSPAGESGRVAADETQHYVTFRQEDFYCAVYPVTCGQLELLGGESASYWDTWTQFADKAERPYCATPMRRWAQIRGETGSDWPKDGHAVTPTSYLGRLSALVGGRAFDLPTDAQWEFLCRAGSGSAWYVDRAAEGGWFDANSGNRAHEVGLKKGNAWGVHDLHGGLWELTLDWYGPMSAEAAEDPCGPASGTSRVWRGGNGAYATIYGRSAARYGGNLTYCAGLYGAFRPITPVSGKWPNGGRVLDGEGE